MTTPHAIARAQERYNVTLRVEDLERLARDCEEGRAVLLANLPDGTRKMLVRYGTVVLVACYSPLKGVILTFLPPHGFSRGYGECKARMKAGRVKVKQRGGQGSEQYREAAE